MEIEIGLLDQRLKPSFCFSQQLADVAPEFLLGQFDAPRSPQTREFVGHEFRAVGVRAQVLHALLIAEPKPQLEYGISAGTLFPTHEPLPAERYQLVAGQS
jgi:hypothetical protein